MERECQICGEKFIPKPNNRKICYKDHIHKCPVCGVYVISNDPKRQNCTCSRECGYKAGNLSRESTVLSRYGVRNVNNLEDVKKKISSSNSKNSSQVMLKCEICGTLFEGKYPYNQHTCSPKCRGIYRKQSGSAKSGAAKSLSTKLMRYGTLDSSKISKPVKYKICPDCGKQFIPDTHRQVYCKGPHFGKCPICGKEVEIKDRAMGPQCCSDICRLKRIEDTMENRYGVAVAFQSKELMKGSYTQVSSNNIKFQEKLRLSGLDSSLEFRIGRKSYDIKCNNYLIEIDPTVTHNSYRTVFESFGGKPVPRDYHLCKSLLARTNGYNCIHIFDWDDQDSIVQQLLSPKRTIYARKCQLHEVDKDSCDEFLNNNHLQKTCRGQSIRLGLYYSNELVEIMTFGKPRYNKNYDWELLRLCNKSSLRIVGGASKLFSHFLHNYSGSVISYCDTAKFDGNVYSKIGMKLEYTTDPAKVWSRGAEKITDNLLRQRGYDQLFKTSYGKGSSNEELMIRSGWLPVYDCGQSVYSYK